MREFPDDEAIEHYDRAGARAAHGTPWAPVRWPDLALEGANLEKLAMGVLESRLDLAREAFGPDFDAAAAGSRLEEAWRVDALQARYAPEGVYVRGAFTVRLVLAAEEVEPGDGDEATEILGLRAEFCVSFVEQHHTRPYIDFMGGEVRRESDGAARTIDPFAFRLDPADAVGWGLNGCDTTC